MSVYAVTYDLKSPGQDYKSLHDALKAYGYYSKRFESFWLIDTAQTAAQIRDNLKQHIDKNDTLFVIEVKEHWAGSNLADGMVNWLRDERRTF